MKYYIKSAKGYWLAQGNGYTKTKAKPMLSLSTKCCSLLSIWTAARSSDSPKHSQRGTHYTFLCKVVRSYKTITPKTPPKTPKAVWGFFRSL